MSNRIHALDSIRGIAAVAVLLFHCAGIFPGFVLPTKLIDFDRWLTLWPYLKVTPLRIFISGPAAVMTFFVLSGFVLSLQFKPLKKVGYWRFVLRRFCRIYPPFAVAILVAAGLSATLASTPLNGVGPWFTTESWTQAVTVPYVIGHLLMIGTPKLQELDNVVWSLIHELRISILFPFILIATRKFPVSTLSIAFLIYILVRLGLYIHPSDSIFASFATTAGYCFVFIAGILIADNLDSISTLVAKIRFRGQILLWLASLFITVYITDPQFAIPANTLAASCIISLTLCSERLKNLLSHGIPVWLGRVSYSLYLWHFLVILTLLHLLNGVAPIWMVPLIAVPLSFLCAEVMCRVIEEPSIYLSRLIGKKNRTNDGEDLKVWPVIDYSDTRNEIP